MRALCGSIITAGALIGLGLASIGIGTRYQTFTGREVDGRVNWVKFSQMDSALVLVLIVLLLAVLVGVGIAFLGLAYHHERRHFERHGRLTTEPELSEAGGVTHP